MRFLIIESYANNSYITEKLDEHVRVREEYSKNRLKNHIYSKELYYYVTRRITYNRQK
jgi:hypothetical protein